MNRDRINEILGKGQIKFGELKKELFGTETKIHEMIKKGYANGYKPTKEDEVAFDALYRTLDDIFYRKLRALAVKVFIAWLSSATCWPEKKISKELLDEILALLKEKSEREKLRLHP
jgi:hypothetical protein